MMPPGELLAKVDAEPPRTYSIRASDRSLRMKMSVAEDAEDDVAELQHGQAVLLQLQEFRAARRNRQPAHRDVGVTLATRRFDADARQIAQDLGGVARWQLGGELRIERTDRDLRIEPVTSLRHAGGDDVLARGLCLSCGGGLIRLRGLIGQVAFGEGDLRVRGGCGKQRSGGQHVMVSLHSILPAGRLSAEADCQPNLRVIDFLRSMRERSAARR